MKKKLLSFVLPGVIFTILALLVFVTACNKDENELIQPTDKGLNEKIQQFVNQTYADYLAENEGFPGGFAVRVLHGGETGFGYQGMGENFTENTHFRGQSTTKSFTAAGIVLLFQKGLLSFESGITDMIPGKDIPYLPDTEDYNIPFKDQISIWQLLNHTAGVYDIVNHDEGEYFVDSIFEQNPEFTMTIDIMTSFISKNQLYDFEPGEAWGYSNSGYQLLAKIIERVSGKSYQQFMIDEFIISLELNETSFPDKGYEQTLPAPYLDSWGWISGESINLTQENMSANVGEGNMITSPRDLCKFYRMLLTGEAGISMSYVSNYMMACVPTDALSSREYGMGLFYYLNLGYGHGGDGSGITVKCFTDVKNDFTVFVLTNCWNFKNGLDDMGPFTKESLMMHDIMFEVKELVLGHYK